MNAAQAGLYVDQLTVTWRNGHTALRDASFSVPRGSIAALVGVNGSGKSMSRSRKRWTGPSRCWWRMW